MHSRQHTEPHTRPRSRRRRCRLGFTMAEVVMAMTVFTMMTLMFAAVFPMAVRGAQYSSNYAQAVMLAQHKMDQIRAAGYDKLESDANGTALSKLSSLGIVDAQNPDGSFDFTTVDNLINDGTTQGYYPPGSTGTFTITDQNTVATANSIGGVPGGTMAYVTVTIAWSGGGVSNGSTTLSAIISKDSHS